MCSSDLAARAGERELRDVAKLRAEGGTPPAVPAELVAFLVSDGASGITGRLISAVWDDWRRMRDAGWRPSNAEWGTLRRVALGS